MYVKGMQYLVQNQNADGSWGLPFGNEPAVVGLCILSILAHGEDPELWALQGYRPPGIEYILDKPGPEHRLHRHIDV